MNVLAYTIISFLLSHQYGEQLRAFHLEGRAQGTTWHITYYASDAIVNKYSIDSILNEIDTSLSLYNPASLIVQFNKSSRGVRTDRFLKDIVQRSLQVSRETKGLSDITIGPLVKAWGFGANPSKSIPDSTALKALLSCTGEKMLVLKGDSLIKTKPCVQIDPNGIAQGYSVDLLAQFIETNGIQNYLIELGGELRVKGKKQPEEEAFRIGIESPSDNDFFMEPLQKIVLLQDGAITTSGNYRQFRESGGKKYGHIINPLTGRPSETEMVSVTVFARDAITADAFDNALMLMSVPEAMNYIESRSDLAAFIIYRSEDGSIADTASARFKTLIKENTQYSN